MIDSESWLVAAARCFCYDEGRDKGRRADVPMFRRREQQPRDLISSTALAQFGRCEILGHDLAGQDDGDVLGLVRPLFDSLWGAPGGRPAAVAELRRHAAAGHWEAVGAWRFAREFLTEEAAFEELRRIGLTALHHMRIQNLAIHLAPIDLEAYTAIAGGPPPHNGFFGPPVFGSDFGPTLKYYRNQAVVAAAARRPARCVRHLPGVEPRLDPAVTSRLWDFGMLVFRGPVLVSRDTRDEAEILAPVLAAAFDVDHSILASRLADQVLEPSDYVQVWTRLGAARFIEEYLLADLTGGVDHRRVLAAGVAELRAPALHAATDTAVEVMTALEREAWAASS